MDDRERGAGEGGWTALLETFRASAHSGASRPETFWTRQHESIRGRVSVRAPARRGWLWPASIAAALLLGAAALELPRAGRVRPAPEEDLDRDLVYDVERTVRRALPAALEPAALLTGELERLWSAPRPTAREGPPSSAAPGRPGESKLTQRSKS